MKSDYLQVRIEPELKEAIKAAAAAENRTVSNFLSTLIKEALKNRGIL